MRDEERGFPLTLFLALPPFIQLFLLSASLAALIITDHLGVQEYVAVAETPPKSSFLRKRSLSPYSLPITYE